MNFSFCIFSFNRGAFLENCVRSAEARVPGAKIAIFDDDSDDPETRDVLATLGKKHPVIQPDRMSSRRLGGLYRNMQSALDYTAKEDMVCFLQDDTQVVRPVPAEDIEALSRTFDRQPDLGFLHPCFIKAANLSRGDTYSYDKSLELYFRNPSTRSSGRYFSALLITRPSRLLAAGWRFAASEPANNRLAKQHFIPMGYLRAPFAMWLPNVPAYRGKKKTLALRLSEKKRRHGYYPFKKMETANVNRLKSEKPPVLPVAEDFLACIDTEPPKPWVYNAITGSRWIKLLNQLEIGLRRLSV